MYLKFTGNDKTCSYVDFNTLTLNGNYFCSYRTKSGFEFYFGPHFKIETISGVIIDKLFEKILEENNKGTLIFDVYSELKKLEK